MLISPINIKNDASADFLVDIDRHCERSDEAIHDRRAENWIDSSRRSSQ